MSLTQLMRERLIHREELDPATKKANEYVVRKFVRGFLDDLDEILWILNHLPERQMRRLFKDEDVFRLLEVVEFALVYRDFVPLRRGDDGVLIAERGLITDPEESGSPRNYLDSRQATDLDIKRFGALRKYLARFTKFERPGPWAIYDALDKIYYADLIKKATKDGYVPAEPGETPDRLWLPRLTEDQRKFRNAQSILYGMLGIDIDSQEDLSLRALKEKIRGRLLSIPKDD